MVLAEEKKVRIGMLGLGTVGGGVVQILERNRDLISERTGIRFEVVRALVRSTKKHRVPESSSIELCKDPEAILNDPDIDLVCEVAGGVSPAGDWLAEAIAQKKQVVTANKAVMASRGQELLKAAAKHKVGLFYEAAVAGGIPIIRTLREGLVSDQVTSIQGILNGTSNFILSRMEAGDDFKRALKVAQKEGFAEADPSLDINGGDAADKLAILIQLAFGLAIDPRKIATEGIDDMASDTLLDAEARNCRVKLLATARRTIDGDDTKIDARVHPVFVPKGHPLASVDGAGNAILVNSVALGASFYQGLGAGALPTGNAVLSDIIDAGRAAVLGAKPSTIVPKRARAGSLLKPQLAKERFYFRFSVKDQTGVLASMTSVFAKEGVSFATVDQSTANAEGEVPLVVTCHLAEFGAVEKALRQVHKLGFVKSIKGVVPMLGAGL